MTFLKACFNFEGNSDGLSFLVVAEMNILAAVICENSFEINRLTKSSFGAEKIVKEFFENQEAIIL